MKRKKSIFGQAIFTMVDYKTKLVRQFFLTKYQDYVTQELKWLQVAGLCPNRLSFSFAHKGCYEAALYRDENKSLVHQQSKFT